MPDYSYVAINKEGKQVKGSMQASDVVAVRSKLKMDGMTMVSAKEQSILTKDIQIGSGKPKTRDLCVFCRQFASILSAGVTVVEALRMLSDQTESVPLKKALIKTRELVQQGETLADAMAQSPKVFDSMFTNMVAAGEESGSLETCVTRMGVQLEKSDKIASLIKSALIYPIAVIVITIAVVILMSLLVVPKFADMFESMGSELPWSTKAVCAIADFLMYKWYILVAIVAAVVIIYKAIGKTEKGKAFYGKIAISAPIFGPLSQKSNSARFARTMSTLVSSGMGITTAIEITGRAMKNILYKYALEKAKDEVEQGIPLSVPIRKAEKEFPPLVHNMLAIGEETGSIENMLDKVAEYYEEETEIASKSMTELMQPVIIVVLGAVVGLMVLAMYQPMISMYGNMGNL